MGSSPRDLSDMLFEDADSLAVEYNVLPVHPESEDVLQGQPRDENLALLEPYSCFRSKIRA